MKKEKDTNKEEQKRDYIKERYGHSMSYFNDNPMKVPSGCRACGGDYPDCRDGCPLFDED